MYFTLLLNSVIKNKLGTRMASRLPVYLEGEVIKGFGRGSKDLGCPTANYPLKVVQSLPEGTEPGVYYGWAQVDSGPVHKMVANIGWCPFYKNKEMSIHKIRRYFEVLDESVRFDISAVGPVKACVDAGMVVAIYSQPDDRQIPTFKIAQAGDADPVSDVYAYTGAGHKPVLKFVTGVIKETHVMHKFDNDFYGSILRICIVGYLRGEKNFNSLNELIEAIQQDIKNAHEKLEDTEAQKFKTATIFTVQNKTL